MKTLILCLLYILGFKILGDLSFDQFVEYFFWAFVGTLVPIFIDLGTRDKKSERTPTKFSWQFWVRDNWKRWIRNIFVICLAIRFYSDIVAIANYNDSIDAWRALGIGIFLDGIIILIKKWRKNKLAALSKNQDSSSSSGNNNNE